jgi:3-hydroxymyristoyl/3-hydroxydecanoyl-(acyl carrier protein) dehydratase
MWYMSKFIDRASDLKLNDGTITACVSVPAESVWFDGHFPDAPLLPGVAQVAMVVEILGEALGQPVNVADVSRVRFKLAIEPGERVDVVVTPREKDASSWGFRLLKGAELACSGFLTLAEE